MEKNFKTYAQQLKILKRRGLDISPVIKSYSTLKDINYYNLINGYNDLFLFSQSPDIYISGSKFKEILALYKFDKDISSLFLKKILEIEAYFKSTIAYVFSSKYGQKSDEYLNSNNFDTKTKRELYNLNKFLVNLNKQIWIDKRTQNYITHYRENHEFVPLWVLVNSMTFGRINTFYSYMKPQDRIKIAQELSSNYSILESDLYNFVRTLNSFRNILAHDERFYNYQKTNNSGLPYRNDYSQYFINVSHQLNSVKSSVFSVLLIFNILLPKEDYKEIVECLIENLDKLEIEISTISKDDVLKEMGFFNNGVIIYPEDLLNLS